MTRVECAMKDCTAVLYLQPDETRDYCRAHWCHLCQSPRKWKGHQCKGDTQ